MGSFMCTLLKLQLWVQCAIVNTALTGLQGILGLEGGTRTRVVVTKQVSSWHP